VRIHVGRLTRNVTKDHVFEIFSSFGDVKNVEFPVDRYHPNFGRGVAFVEYATAEDCESAIRQQVAKGAGTGSRATQSLQGSCPPCWIQRQARRRKQ